MAGFTGGTVAFGIHTKIISIPNIFKSSLVGKRRLNGQYKKDSRDSRNANKSRGSQVTITE